jgi:hypothetical protein
VAIIFSIVTLAHSAMEAKLVKSPMVEMQQNMKSKQKERDNVLATMTLQNLEHMRQMKAGDERSTLLVMKRREELEQADATSSSYMSAQLDDAPPVSSQVDDGWGWFVSAPSSSCSAQDYADPDEVMMCKVEGGDDWDAELKAYEALKGHVKEEEGIVKDEEGADQPLKPKPKWGQIKLKSKAKPKPKSKLLSVGQITSNPMKRPAAAPKAKPVAKLKGSALSGEWCRGSTGQCTTGQGLNIVFRMHGYKL